MTTEQTVETVSNGEVGGYTFEVMDELPTGAPRRSKLEDVLEKIKTLPHGKPICIKRFEKAATATASANNFKLRWGTKPDAYGFQFKTRKLDETPVSYGLFVIYDPSKIMQGANVEVDKRYNEYRENQAVKQKEREVKKAREAKAQEVAKVKEVAKAQAK